MLALVDNQPKILNLKEILVHYLNHQKEIIIRRTEYDLKKAKARAHIVEGLLIALDNIDEIIKIIRASYNDAEEKLMERFELSDIKAKAIVDMMPVSYTHLDVYKRQVFKRFIRIKNHKCRNSLRNSSCFYYFNIFVTNIFCLSSCHNYILIIRH